MRSWNEPISSFLFHSCCSSPSGCYSVGPQFQEPSALLFTASPGEDVAMACPARGNPEPRIDWRRESGHEVLHRGVTYRKDNLREEDFGTYVCTAYVQDFPPISKQMYIAKRRKWITIHTIRTHFHLLSGPSFFSFPSFRWFIESPWMRKFVLSNCDVK